MRKLQKVQISYSNIICNVFKKENIYSSGDTIMSRVSSIYIYICIYIERYIYVDWDATVYLKRAGEMQASEIFGSQ